MILTKDQLLQYKLPLLEYPISELGGSVFLRVMSGTERDLFETLWSDERYKDKNIDAELLVRVITDAEGVRMFADEDAEKINSLLDYRIIRRMAEAALKFNAMQGKESTAEAGKDSGADQKE